MTGLAGAQGLKGMVWPPKRVCSWDCKKVCRLSMAGSTAAGKTKIHEY